MSTAGSKILLVEHRAGFAMGGFVTGKPVPVSSVITARPMGTCGWRGDLAFDEVVLNSGEVLRGVFGDQHVNFTVESTP